MSYPPPSIVSNDNIDLKYKKALKQISKLISANQVLNQNYLQNKLQCKDKMDQLAIRYEDLEKEYNIIMKEKETFANYLDDLQKEKNNLQRENAYLSDCYSDHKAELKKFQMFKDEKAIAELIKTYQEKQSFLKRTHTQNEGIINQLKETLVRFENQIQSQRSQKEDYQERYESLQLELSRYKGINSTLIYQNERLLTESTQKDEFCIEKQKQLSILVDQLKSQVSLFKHKSERSINLDNSSFVQNYETLLQQKNQLEVELNRMHDIFEQSISRQKKYLEIEQREKLALLRCDRAIEEVNMLRNKIVVMEAHEILNESQDFEERLNTIVSEDDPLEHIKNGEDNSHFLVLKSFIVDLQEKVKSLKGERRQMERKYKRLKKKFIKNTKELEQYESQSKLLRGKLNGYDNLTQKLHNQLEKSIVQNEEEIMNMTITSNNILHLKTDQYQSNIDLLTSKLQIAQQRAATQSQNMTQHISTLQLELDTLKIKYANQSESFKKQTQLIELYQKKNNQIQNHNQQLEEELLETQQHVQQLLQKFKEEKGKNQGFIVQKQLLVNQNKQLTQELDKKKYYFNQQTKTKQEKHQNELKKVIMENNQFKEEVEYQQKLIKRMEIELEEKRNGEQKQVEEIKRLTNQYKEMQGKIFELRKMIRKINEENDLLKIKGRKFEEIYEKYNKLEEELIMKSDHVNDLQREKIVLQNDFKHLQTQHIEQKNRCQELQKEILENKFKILDSNHQIKKEQELKSMEHKKIIHSLNENVSELTSSLRDEKSKNQRIVSDLNSMKAEKNRLENLIEQNHKKDFQNENSLSNLNYDLSSANMQIQRLKNHIKSFQGNQVVVKQEIEGMQRKIFSLNQNISGLKMKLQMNDDEKRELQRNLNLMKNDFIGIENYCFKLRVKTSSSWEQQNFITSLTEIIGKMKTIGRKLGIIFDNKIHEFPMKLNQSLNYNSPNNSLSFDLKGDSQISKLNFASNLYTIEKKLVTTESIKDGSQMQYTYSQSNEATKRKNEFDEDEGIKKLKMGDTNTFSVNRIESIDLEGPF